MSQTLSFPEVATLLHELTYQFDGIPSHAVKALAEACDDGALKNRSISLRSRTPRGIARALESRLPTLRREVRGFFELPYTNGIAALRSER